MNIKESWSHLNERERWLVSIAGVCSVFYAIYVLLYAPLVTAVDDKIQQYADKTSTLAWMQQVQQQHKTHKAAKVLTSSQLLTLFATQLNTTSFHRFPYQLQQTGTGAIQLMFDEVPYNSFIVWLWTLGEQYAFTIAQLTVEHTHVAGVVKLTVIIDAVKPH